jgi:hypothetical protein
MICCRGNGAVKEANLTGGLGGETVQPVGAWAAVRFLKSFQMMAANSRWNAALAAVHFR